jgi:hypothetical protein
MPSAETDDAFVGLTARIEQLQHELAALRAEAAAHMSTSEALRRASAFAGDPAHRPRPVCRTRGAIETPIAAEPPAASDPVLDLSERAFAIADQARDLTVDTQRSRTDTPLDVVRTDNLTALRAISANGRGAVFAGGTAPIRLLPHDDATHPDAGRAGDLFVDARHRLWFCRNPHDWVQIA